MAFDDDGKIVFFLQALRRKINLTFARVGEFRGIKAKRDGGKNDFFNFDDL